MSMIRRSLRRAVRVTLREVSPESDGGATPFLRRDVAQGLDQLPAVTGRILQHAGALAVLMARRFLDHSRPSLASPDEGGVHVGHADLDHVCDAPGARWDLLAVDVRDDEGTVPANPQLSPVRLADADSLLETERRFQPGNRSSDIGVDKHWRHGGRWRRTIGQHTRQPRRRGGARTRCHRHNKQTRAEVSGILWAMCSSAETDPCSLSVQPDRAAPPTRTGRRTRPAAPGPALRAWSSPGSRGSSRSSG